MTHFSTIEILTEARSSDTTGNSQAAETRKLICITLGSAALGAVALASVLVLLALYPG